MTWHEGQTLGSLLPDTVGAVSGFILRQVLRIEGTSICARQLALARGRTRDLGFARAGFCRAVHRVDCVVRAED